MASDTKELLYSNFLELFINLNFSEDEAKNHYENIINNIDFMKNLLNREIGLRVAIVEYFFNHTEMMKEPIVVEMRVFKENEKLALVDSLTGLFNKRYYDIAIRKDYNKELFSYGVKFNDIDTKDANKLKKILPDKFQNLSYEDYL